MSVLCSHWVVQHSLGSLGDSGGVSGPSDSGSRSTSGDTSEDKTVHRDESECYIQQTDVTCNSGIISYNSQAAYELSKRQKKTILNCQKQADTTLCCFFGGIYALSTSDFFQLNNKA